MRKLLLVLVLLLVAASVTYVVAGRAAGPTIEIVRPQQVVGTDSQLEVVMGTPAGRLSAMRIAFEQNGSSTELYSLGGDTSRSGVTVTPDGPDRLRITRPVGRQSIPGIVQGPARIVISASRPTLMGLRSASAQATRDVQVRLDPPRVSVASTYHYVNVGGSEMVVYRVSPPDVQSGVKVGEFEYPGYPASGADLPGAALGDPALRIAFFALRYDQPLDTPIALFARDTAGNVGRATFDYRTFPKPFKKSRIELDDAFLERVVPAIMAGTKEVTPEGSLLDKYLVLNGELRRKNAERIRSVSAETAHEMLWKGDVFFPFTNSATESAFADQRTYIYQEREVDHQVHLGFDLASYANTPVVASNRGKVLFAQELGIYGNCVIVDHGMGVQSLYAHLSSFSVKVGDMVEKAQPLGKSGMTGMAGGDHLHFTMLVNGQMVNPVEWWDSHWIQDRVLRKLRP
ncbi:MAG: M23 family metallopeptidase [Vicinamibacterales bacterium]